MTLRRRDLLGLAGAASALRLEPAASAPIRFQHGVASGDPGARDILLWTRVTPGARDHRPVPVRWTLWRDGQTASSASGTTLATPDRDFTVKVAVHGLEPATDYLFAFEADSVLSPTGRTRTLPEGPTADVVLVAAACQSFTGGLFNAWDAVARLDRVDAVIHLGDYIYEHGPGPDVLGRAAAFPDRAPDPPRELVTLDDYRRRHAQYKSDPDLQAAHARAPFICTLDDHEIANNAWLSGAESHTPGVDGDYAARKAAALRAWFEWMPIREPEDGLTPAALNRVFHFGDLASLAMLETRLTARDRPLAYETDLDDADGRPDVRAFEARRLAPHRRLIGDAQRAWIADTLAASRAAGRPWQLLGNQVLMARVGGPHVGHFSQPWLVDLVTATLPAALRLRVRRMIEVFRLGLPWSLDSWDGYPAERERLYDALSRAGVQPLVLSGDSHAWWVNRLFDQAGRRRAVEFGVTAVTSPSVGDAAPRLPLGEALARANDEVLFCQQTGKGFLRLTLTPEEARADLMTVSTIRAKPYRLSTLRTFRVTRAEDGAGEVAAI